MIKLRCSSEMQAGALYFDYAVWNFVCLDGRFVSGSNGIYTNLLGGLRQAPSAKSQVAKDLGKLHRVFWFCYLRSR